MEKAKMLKAIELENFKAFGERCRIELAPITLIFGENSAGKSLILQALHVLKQLGSIARQVPRFCPPFRMVLRISVPIQTSFSITSASSLAIKNAVPAARIESRQQRWFGTPH